MTAKGKLIRNGIIAVAAVGVLAGGYYLAVKWEPASQEEETVGQSAVISLMNLQTDEIQSVRIQNPTQTYTLTQDQDGTVAVEELPGIVFRQMSLKSALSSFSSISAVREITDDMSRAAEFGLDRRDVSVSVTSRAGETRTFFLGDSLPGESSYYFMEESGDKIYTLASYKAEAVFKTTNDYRDTELLSLENATVERFSVAKGGQVLLSIRPAGEEDHPQNTVNPYWVTEAPYPGEGVSADRIGNLLDTFKTVRILQFVDDAPAQLEAYGLGPDAYEIALSTSENSYQFRLGSRAEDGSGVYMQWNGGPSVYLGDEAFLDALETLNPSLYVEKFVHIANIEDIAQVELTTGAGSRCLLEVGEGEEEDNPDKYKLNGQTIEPDSFKKLYQKVIGILYVNQVEASPAGAPVLTVTYRYRDGRTDTSNYYEYDERYYAAERSDGVCLTILRTDLAQVIETAEENS